MNDESSSSEQGSAEASGAGYFDHVREVLLQPDRALTSDKAGDSGHAIIDLGVYFGAVFVAALFARVIGYSGWGFEFGYAIEAVKGVLTIGIPIGLAVFALNALGDKSGEARSMAFYVSKLGAGLLLPALLLLGAVVLHVLDIRIHSWLRGLAMAYVYVLVFLLAYGYAMPGKLRNAILFLAGFYVAYRLLALLF